MNNLNLTVFSSLFLTFCSIVCAKTLAQELPKVQKISKKAPIGIKIDGDHSDWGSQFEAKNIVNRISYSLSNDNNNLYLTVMASDGFANEKAVMGIGLSITLPDQKEGKSKKMLTINYPGTVDIDKSDDLRFSIERLRKMTDEIVGKPSQRADSLRKEINKGIGAYLKMIDVSGINGVTLETISIYNAAGIRAASKINEDYKYFYELAIPLKNLGEAINQGTSFAYKIFLDGVQRKTTDNRLAPPTISGNVLEFRGADNAYVSYPTSLSGTYALSK
ncbi:hypothetical protein ASU31_00705 [Pedobacter ginsenosidimutans]|uniref:Uncharacterized protein n=1 Tax=Pedobacter ginsenosidimutans TaxID=687842 RepID=A0A0T5VVK1_9SPHI|nr:hypothetical protein [Pedobacter ginsenosidimutans]KRT17848.1 hypothetical protein ASU31_00705 [Pedobacter ginsenosidimutans]